MFVSALIDVASFNSLLQKINSYRVILYRDATVVDSVLVRQKSLDAIQSGTENARETRRPR